jgi:hypothetical protein
LPSGPDVPARAPADYTLPHGLLDLEQPDALQNGRAVQSLLYSMALPAHEGAALLEAIHQAARTADADMSDVSFELRTRETEAVLKRQLGPEEYGRRREALTAMLTDLDSKSNGALADLLGENAVALSDPMVMSKLLSHAGRAHARKR